jgi:hypothetical protein
VENNIENLILEHLKALRNELRDFRTRTEEEFQDVKLRLSSLERGQAKNHADYSDLYGDHARQQSSIDRLSERLDRIERRLDLTE